MLVVIDGVQYVPAPVPAEGKTLDAALDHRMGETDAGDHITVREWLEQLLLELWDKGEWFSSKRPFGNGGWWLFLGDELAKAGFLDFGKPVIDFEGDIPHFNHTDEQLAAAKEYVKQLIKRVFETRPA